MNLKNRITLILFFSLLVKVTFLLLFYEKNISDEWSTLLNNFIASKKYSFYVFDGEYIPSSYMPPLYFLFIYLCKVFSFGLFNFIYLIYFFQIIFSTISVFLFYKICRLFLNENFSLLGTTIFAFFPLIIFSNSLISSACLQIFLYLLFLKYILKLIENKFIAIDYFKIIIVSSLCLLLRGEFLIIFIFSIVYIITLRRKKILEFIFILLISFLLISPYVVRNYENTGKIHIVNVSGYALWKGNNHLLKVEGFHDPLHPNERKNWPDIFEFQNLYKNLDKIKKDKKYEINRDEVFKKEALNNIFENKDKYIIFYFKKFLSYYFIDLSSSISNYYNIFHIMPVLLISFLSIPGAIFSVKEKDPRIIYLIFLMLVITSLVSVFFILPRYKISILIFQIFFSIFFLKKLSYFINKKKLK